MKSKFQRGLVAVAGTAALALAGPLPVHAAQDVTPPKLHTPTKAHFIVGTQLSEFQEDDGIYFYTVPQRISWTGSDDSGFVFYQVYDHLAGDDPDLLTETLDTTYDVLSSDYDSQFGGGSFATTNWSVVAKDGSGNATGHAVYGAYLTVTQDDGSQTREHETSDVAISYTGNWTVANCACFAAGTTHKTSQSGATAVIDVNVAASEGNRAVAVVMEKAPNRGRARIVVDGVNRGVVDTLAGAATHQTVVWTRMLGVGAHTIEVVNLATPGRARIDLDAVVVSAAHSF